MTAKDAFNKVTNFFKESPKAAGVTGMGVAGALATFFVPFVSIPLLFGAAAGAGYALYRPSHAEIPGRLLVGILDKTTNMLPGPGDDRNPPRLPKP